MTTAKHIAIIEDDEVKIAELLDLLSDFASSNKTIFRDSAALSDSMNNGCLRICDMVISDLSVFDRHSKSKLIEIGLELSKTAKLVIFWSVSAVANEIPESCYFSSDAIAIANQVRDINELVRGVYPGQKGDNKKKHLMLLDLVHPIGIFWQVHGMPPTKADDLFFNTTPPNDRWYQILNILISGLSKAGDPNEIERVSRELFSITQDDEVVYFAQNLLDGCVSAAAWTSNLRNIREFWLDLVFAETESRQ